MRVFPIVTILCLECLISNAFLFFYRSSRQKSFLYPSSRLSFHSKDLDYQLELKRLKECTTAQLLDEYKQSNAYLPGFIDRNELEHRLAQNRVQQRRAAANAPSKRYQAHLLRAELDKLNLYSRSELLHLLQRRNVTITLEESDFELKVLLAQSNLRGDENSPPSDDNFFPSLDLESLLNRTNLESVLNKSVAFTEGLGEGVQSVVLDFNKGVVEGVGSTLESLSSTAAEKQVKSAFQDRETPSNTRSSYKRIDFPPSSSPSSPSPQTHAMPSTHSPPSPSSPTPTIAMLRQQLSAQRDFDSVARWARAQTRGDVVALLLDKGLGLGQLRRLTFEHLCVLLADAELASRLASAPYQGEQGQSTAASSAQRSRTASPSGGSRRWSDDPLYLEKDLVYRFKQFLPKFIVGSFNAVTHGVNDGIEHAFRLFSAQANDPTSVLGSLERGVVAFSSLCIHATLAVARWAGGGRIGDKVVVFFCTAYAVLTRRGLRGWLSALVGVKLFSVLLKVSQEDHSKKSVD
eukprot:gene38613-46941_t